MLTAYVVAGFVFSAGIGIMLVILLGLSAGPRAPGKVRAVIPFMLGAVSPGYAAAQRMDPSTGVRPHHGPMAML